MARDVARLVQNPEISHKKYLTPPKTESEHSFLYLGNHLLPSLTTTFTALLDEPCQLLSSQMTAALDILPFLPDSTAA